MPHWTALVTVLAVLLYFSTALRVARARVGDVWAAVLGLVWIGGRILYIVGYAQAVPKRLPGFFTQGSACIALFIGDAIGIVVSLVHG